MCGYSVYLLRAAQIGVCACVRVWLRAMARRSSQLGTAAVSSRLSDCWIACRQISYHDCVGCRCHAKQSRGQPACLACEEFAPASGAVTLHYYIEATPNSPRTNVTHLRRHRVFESLVQLFHRLRDTPVDTVH
eukprot:COSAG01_NODE_4185_length_5261_cov_2.430260_3_plen_133_part_00